MESRKLLKSAPEDNLIIISKRRQAQRVLQASFTKPSRIDDLNVWQRVGKNKLLSLFCEVYPDFYRQVLPNHQRIILQNFSENGNVGGSSRNYPDDSKCLQGCGCWAVVRSTGLEPDSLAVGHPSASGLHDHGCQALCSTFRRMLGR